MGGSWFKPSPGSGCLGPQARREASPSLQGGLQVEDGGLGLGVRICGEVLGLMWEEVRIGI